MSVPCFYVGKWSTVSISENGIVHVVGKSGSDQVETASPVSEVEAHVENVRAAIMAWHIAKVRGAGN